MATPSAWPGSSQTGPVSLRPSASAISATSLPLTSRLSAVRGDATLLLPAAHAGRRYRDVFTGTAHSVALYSGAPGLPLASLLADFPVALLERIA